MMHYPKTREEWLALRHKYVSSTETAALFGYSPWITAFELAVAKKADKPMDLEHTERMGWGLRLQEAIAKGISDDYGVKVRRINGYATLDNLMGCGASFDYEIVGIKEDVRVEDPMLREMYKDLGPGILEVKNVDWLIFKKEWKLDDGQLEAPAHIEIQVQQELHCINREWGVMGVLVGGNDCQLVIRERDKEVGAAIEKKVQDFWMLIEKGGMPPVKLPDDVEIIKQIYLLATPGKVYNGNEDTELKHLCEKYAEARELAKVHDEARKSIGAKILMRIGDAEKATVEGYSISADTREETLVEAYTRKAYRNLTIREKGKK